MTAGLRAYLEAQGAEGREALRRESAKALQVAWPHRHTSGRAPVVIQSNVRMLRNLRAFAPLDSDDGWNPHARKFEDAS